MKYPIAIEPATDTSIFGVVIPDFPGCFSAGDTLEEAFDNARGAAEAWIEEAKKDEELIPGPSTVESLKRDPEFKGWIFDYIDVNLEDL